MAKSGTSMARDWGFRISWRRGFWSLGSEDRVLRLCTVFGMIWTLLNTRWREGDRRDLVGVFVFGCVFLPLKLVSASCRDE